MENYFPINRYISIIQRLGNGYFDKQLCHFHLGCGQQFFLLQISKNPGISFQELAAGGRYDKATATRAVKKLEEEGYVRLETDTADKRIRHISITPKAVPVIEKTWEILGQWIDILTMDFSEEEKGKAEELLRRMKDNADYYMRIHKGGE